jgi:hypothetical protein
MTRGKHCHSTFHKKAYRISWINQGCQSHAVFAHEELTFQGWKTSYSSISHEKRAGSEARRKRLSAEARKRTAVKKKIK